MMDCKLESTVWIMLDLILGYHFSLVFVWPQEINDTFSFCQET